MQRTYKILKLAGVSSTSYEDAIESAVETAAKTHAQLDWFEVREQRGKIIDGKIGEYQVVIEAAYKLQA